MKKSIIVASMLGLFAATSFAQASAPAAASQPAKVSAPHKHKHHPHHPHHKAGHKAKAAAK